MKRCYPILVWAVLMGLIPVSGCKKKESAPEAEVAKQSAASKENETEPSQASSLITPGDKKDSEPKEKYEVPQYVTDTVEHIQKVNALIRDNLKSCKAVLKQVSGYLEKNRDRIKKFQNEAIQAHKNMSDAQKMMLANELHPVMSKLMKESNEIKNELYEKCPEEAKRIDDLLKEMRPDIPPSQHGHSHEHPGDDHNHDGHNHD